MEGYQKLHEHTVNMINSNEKRIFFVTYSNTGRIEFHMKVGSGTTTVFGLSKKQFLDISEKISANFIKKQRLVTNLITITDEMSDAYEELSEKIATNKANDVFTDLKEYNRIRTKLINIKNKIKQADFII